jgi:hypothetical protein
MYENTIIIRKTKTMKKTVFKFMTVLALSLMTISCQKEDDNPMVDNQETINQLTAVSMSGMWRITNFIDSGDDHTSEFANYSFNFQDNNVLTATDGQNTVTGSWSITSDDSSSDDSSDSSDIDFNINFSAPLNFSELTEDWEILTYTDTLIELRHISGGNGGTDLLTLEK